MAMALAFRRCSGTRPEAITTRSRRPMSRARGRWTNRSPTGCCSASTAPRICRLWTGPRRNKPRPARALARTSWISTDAGARSGPELRFPTRSRDATRVDVPTLMFSGRRDPVTPPRTAEDAGAFAAALAPVDLEVRRPRRRWHAERHLPQPDRRGLHDRGGRVARRRRLHGSVSAIRFRSALPARPRDRVECRSTPWRWSRCATSARTAFRATRPCPDATWK